MNWFLELFGSYDNPSFKLPTDKQIREFSPEPYWVSLFHGRDYYWGKNFPKTNYSFKMMPHPHGFPSQLTLNMGIDYSYCAIYHKSFPEIPELSFRIADGHVSEPTLRFRAIKKDEFIVMKSLENRNVGLFHPNFYKNDFSRMAAVAAITNQDIRMLYDIVNDPD